MAETILQNLIEFIPKVRGAGFQQLNKGIMASHKSLFSLRNMFGAFFGYDLYSSIRNIIPSMVDVSQKIGAMESRFRAVSTSAKAGADELNWVAGQSKRLGLDFLNTADNYSIFFATLKNSMGQGQTRQIFEQWAEAFRVLHVPKEQQSRVLYALREMSSKGKIYMQDLALQLGNAVPDAMGLAAKSMGYTGVNATNKFRQAIKDGDIDVKKFLVTFSRMVNKTYVDSGKLAEAMNKPDAQLQSLAANMQLLQIAIAKAGFEKDLVKFLKLLNAILPKIERHAHGIYVTIRNIIILLGIFIGGKFLINLISSIMLIKKLQMALFLLRLEILKTQMAGVAIGGGAAAGGLLPMLLGFLTNPYVLGAILLAGLTIGLVFLLKKFFPNVWSSIMAYMFIFKRWVWNLLREIDNHPAVKALKAWFGTEKKGFSKDVEDRQKKWKEIAPNYESVYKTAGFLDALGAANLRYMNAMNPIKNINRASGFVGEKIAKYIIEQKYKIDVKVDGVQDKESIMMSVNSAFDKFAERNKADTASSIINSSLFGRSPSWSR